MSPHKIAYCKAMGYDTGDYIPSEVPGAPAVDVHAIIADGMGGRPNKETHRIENLIALTRKEHTMYGDKKQWKQWLFQVHRNFLLERGIQCDYSWIEEQIEKYSVTSHSDQSGGHP